MNNVVISLIRTWTTIVVGAVAAWLTARGFNLDPATQSAVVAALTGGIAAVYYGLVRLIESKVPWLGFLLGHTAKPVYAKKA